MRQTMRAPVYDHPAHAELASGRAPCRVGPEKFEPSRDRRIVFNYDPFHTTEPDLPLPGHLPLTTWLTENTPP